MKNLTVALFFAVFLIQGCGGGNSSGEEGATVTRSILGEWRYVYPATQCVEVNTFNENGAYQGIALDEIYSGNYTFDSTIPEGSRHKISLSITEDNGLSDCNGSSSIDVGLEVTLYVEFISENTIVYYENNSGGDPIIEFERVVQ